MTVAIIRAQRGPRIRFDHEAHVIPIYIQGVFSNARASQAPRTSGTTQKSGNKNTRKCCQKLPLTKKVARNGSSIRRCACAGFDVARRAGTRDVLRTESFPGCERVVFRCRGGDNAETGIARCQIPDDSRGTAETAVGITVESSAENPKSDE